MTHESRRLIVTEKIKDGVSFLQLCRGLPRRTLELSYQELYFAPY